MPALRLFILSCMALSWSVFAQAQLSFNDAYVRGLPPGQPNTAAFMRILNGSSRAIRIDDVSTPIAAKAEFHAHIHKDGMMKMEAVKSITIPATGFFALKPGGYHLMLMGLREPLRDGDKVMVEFTTDEGDSFDVELEVRSVMKEKQK